MEQRQRQSTSSTTVGEKKNVEEAEAIEKEKNRKQSVQNEQPKERGKRRKQQRSPDGPCVRSLSNRKKSDAVFPFSTWSMLLRVGQ